jgi:hypothetical protein
VIVSFASPLSQTETGVLRCREEAIATHACRRARRAVVGGGKNYTRCIVLPSWGRWGCEQGRSGWVSAVAGAAGDVGMLGCVGMRSRFSEVVAIFIFR